MVTPSSLTARPAGWFERARGLGRPSESERHQHADATRVGVVGRPELAAQELLFKTGFYVKPRDEERCPDTGVDRPARASRGHRRQDHSAIDRMADQTVGPR